MREELERERQRRLAAERETERLAAELQAERGRFDAFSRHSPVTSLLKDAHGRYIWIAGFRRDPLYMDGEEVLGRTAFDLFPPEVAARLAAADAEVLSSGSTVEAVETLTVPGGELRHRLVIKFPVRDLDDRLLVGIVSLDITERVRSEERLRLSERRLAEAQQVARMGSWEYDLRTDQITWSTELYRLYGIGPPGEPISLEQLLSVLVPDDAARVRREVADALCERRPVDLEYRIQAPDGTTRVVHDRGEFILDDAGEPVRMVGTAQDITERKQAEERLRQYAASLEAVSLRLIEVQEAERRHLARELHDDVGQALTALRACLLPDETIGAEATRRFEQARGILDPLLQRVRGLSFALRPAVLDELGLMPALLALFDWYTSHTGVAVEFRHSGLGERAAPEVEIAAYRIVQEALTNVARHAGTSEAVVRIWRSGDTLGVRIEDSGRGFDASAAVTNYRAAGLRGMQERVALLGGELTIESRLGRGTQILAQLPSRPAPPGSAARNRR